MKALIAILLSFGLTIPAQAQEPQCDETETICAEIKGNHVSITFLSEEVLKLKLPDPMPPQANSPTLPPKAQGDPQGSNPSASNPPVIITPPRLFTERRVEVPGPTVTVTATPRPAPTVTVTPAAIVIAPDALPPRTITIERAIKFGLGALLLLMVIATLGMMFAYAVGYRHSETNQGHMLARLRDDVFGGRHRG
jgi:hypothetical protein